MRPATAVWFALIALVLLPGIVRPFASSGDDGADSSHFRIALSEKVVGGDVNENDVRNALKAWAAAVAQQSGITVEYPRGVLSTSEDLVQSIRKRLLDGFTITTAEYMQVASSVDPTSLIVDQAYADGGDQYLLLVHEDSPLRSLQDLRGRTIMLPNSPKTSLVTPWIETLLAASRLPPASEHFSRITKKPKLAQVVLPVFFRQADACVATRTGFAVLCEMNPQLGTKLRVLATSPKLVTHFFAIHKDCAPGRRSRFSSSLFALYQTPYGKQALTLFQSGRLVSANVSCLRSSIELLKAFDRLSPVSVGGTR